jgi:RNA polymerase sigma-70 factor (ECF subfamily)
MTAANDPDTDQLLEEAGRGSESARGQLLLRHRKRLRAMVDLRMDRRLAGRIDPSDVVQETFADAVAQLSDYLRRRPLPFYPWLRQLACDRLAELNRHHLRAQKRSVRREEALGLSDESALELADRLIARGSSPSARLLRHELGGRVQSAMARLADPDREILVLRHLEHLTTSEIAAVLGIREGTAYTRHLRALRRLRAFLEGGITEGEP